MVQLTVFQTKMTKKIARLNISDAILFRGLTDRSHDLNFVRFCCCVLKTVVSNLNHRRQKCHNLDAEAARARETHLNTSCWVYVDVPSVDSLRHVFGRI